MDIIRRGIRFTIVILLVGLVSGCNTITMKRKPPIPDYQVIPPAQRAQVIRDLNRWQVNGVFSLQRGNKLVVMAFYWTQFAPARYNIRMRSAMNFYHLDLKAAFGTVTLWKSDTKYVQAKSAEKLMYRELGWSLPVSDLFYWIRGIPGPGRSVREYDHWGHLTKLMQKGWTIDYSDYRKVLTSVEVDVPMKIVMVNNNLRIKIVIRNWLHLFRSVKDLDDYDSTNVRG